LFSFEFGSHSRSVGRDAGRYGGIFRRFAGELGLDGRDAAHAECQCGYCRKKHALHKLIIAGFIGCVALGSTGAVSEEKDRGTDEAAIMANAKISMAQAIATAEQVTGGKAVGTGIEDQDGTVFLEVQILKANQRQKVLVDPQSGQVAKAVAEDEEEEVGR
jgi:hypothetical protein